MKSVLCTTIRFLDPVPQFHGRGDDGTPEWPPSPLRLFQALVCASATRWRDNLFQEYARPALQWLEALRPSIVAPQVPAESFGYRMYVPNNSGDLMTAAWARGDTETSMAKFRVEKDVRPTHLTAKNDEFAAVHYLYPITDATEFAKHKQTLIDAARSVTHLGWGVDMVAGNAQVQSEEEVAKLAGEHWHPVTDAFATQLRVPRAGTLEKLMEKHHAFLNRLSDGGFKPVPPLTAFDTVGYRRDTDPAGREWVAFRITSVDPDAPNPAFDTPRRARDVAAWVRHATGQACAGWPFGDPAPFVHGHVSSTDGQPLRGEGADNRFMYLPLPTINHALGRVESIRRVLIAAPPGFRDRVEWVRRRLVGQELVWGTESHGLLADLPASDWVLQRYTGESRVWSTVTPVVWPGHDDHDPVKAGRVLGKAFADAGLPVAEGVTELAWRNVGFRAGVDLASRYALPTPLTGRRYHVRVRFAHPVRGPLAVGAGRYRGLGVFVAEPD